MPSAKNKNTKNKSPAKKVVHAFLSVVEFVISTDYIKFRIWGLVFVLSICALAGMLGKFERKSLISTILIVLGYFLLSILLKWLLHRH